MNLEDYRDAVKKIHCEDALILWSFYKSRRTPVTKKYILKHLDVITTEAELDKSISYLSERGFEVELKEE